jgi:hypothetical protein
MTAPLVTPTDCLWNDIDSYLVARVTADLGMASAYTTLQVQEVHVDDTLEPEEHWDLPAVVISSFMCEPGRSFGGDTDDSAVNCYRCGITAVLSADSYDQARHDTKELIRRIAKLGRSLGALGRLASTDGETVFDSGVAMQQARIYPAQGSETVWYGAAIVGVDIYAEVAQ